MSIVRVAELAGVSHTTVSRVINNHPSVSDEAAAAVRKAMGKLGYTPPVRRRGPKPGASGRGQGPKLLFLGIGGGVASGGVGTIGGFRSAPVLQSVMEGMSFAARQHGLDLGFTHVPNADDPLPAGLIREGVSGLLLHGSRPSPALAERLRHVPAVWVMGQRRRPDWGDQVMANTIRVGQLAAEHLAGRGHRSVAFLNLDTGHWVLRLYRDAFRTAAEEAGLDVQLIEHVSPSVDTRPGAMLHEQADAVVARYLRLKSRPTGLFIASDSQAAVIQPALQQRGVAIGPGAVEVVSCNNEEPFLAGLRPRPAVVDIDAHAIGRLGVEQLLTRLRKPDLPARVLTLAEPHLVLLQ